ncbi:putative calcium-transporting ATPase 13 [Spatholobus suberectus]|nr:putative calcium-transporting ATPase 13 [Spatholobus suberectus]
MSMSLLTNLKRIEVLLNAPNTVSAPTKRWHSAFVAIYCSRAIMSHFTPNNTNKTKAKVSPTPTPSFTVVDLYSHHSFDIDQTTLTDIVKEKDLQNLDKFGGVEGVASALETHVEYGIKGDDADAEDITRRKEVFGSNTYNKPPSKGFFHFVVEAFKDVTILILLACAAFSLGFGIKEHGLKEGWYDGGSIFVAVFIVISMSSISNFRQSRQFDKLSQVSNDIQIDVVRSGRRQHVSIFEIVVGDVICLKIGDQVPADGLFIEGHSLKVDESSMTGESDQC